MTQTAFGMKMTALNYKRAKRGGQQRYENIALAQAFAGPQLVVSNDQAEPVAVAI